MFHSIIKPHVCNIHYMTVTKWPLCEITSKNYVSSLVFSLSNFSFDRLKGYSGDKPSILNENEDDLKVNEKGISVTPLKMPGGHCLNDRARATGRSRDIAAGQSRGHGLVCLTATH